MRVPLSWLRDFAPFEVEPRALGLVFDELGMVVEGIEEIGRGLDGVVVARILSIAPIEGLDRVRMTTVDAGDGGEPLEVACGAWNISVGDVVPLATVGTTLPNGMTIGRRKLKKVVSNGMLCSAIELGLGTDAEGILLLDPSVAPGMPLREALGISADVVYDLAIEGNRPDANSVVGVARDAAAKLGLPFTLPSPSVVRTGPPSWDAATVVVEAPDLSPRFTATVITGVSIGPSPTWVQRRLTLAGMRPINNVVDASNYVMLELGQPTHPYDLDVLAGRGLRVRRARPGEVVTTLDDVERVVGEGGDDCLICDGDDVPIGIAGIMGGASTEISSSTTNVLLEVAYFAPMAIARTSKRLRLRTEASARFEKGCDPAGIDLAVARFCELLGAGEVASSSLDLHEGLQPPSPIRLRTSRLNALLGTDLGDDDVVRYLTPIGFSVSPVEPGVQSVVPPTFRPDVTIEVNLIEEVARHHGYAKIARTVPHSPQVGGLSEYQADRRLVRSILVGAGVDEAQSPSLLGPGEHERAGLVSAVPIAAADAMIVEESLLRTSLLPGLLRALAFNAARRSPDVSFFEVGPVFTRPSADRVVEGPDAALPDERERLAVALGGAGGDAVRAKHVLDTLVEGLRLVDVSLEAVSSVEGLHPARSARVLVSGVDAGVVGEVDPAVVTAWGLSGRVGWIDLDLGLVLAATRKPLEQLPISKFPSSDVDLAFVLSDDVPAAAVETALRDGAGDLLSSVELFDVYRGDQVPAGTRSLAYRLRFVALDRTLTDAEVAAARAAAIAAAEAAGASLRA